MKNKKKYLAFIRSFSGLEAQMNSQDYVWEALSKNFERIYFINDDNLKFFPNFKQEWIQKKYDFEELKTLYNGQWRGVDQFLREARS